MAFQTQWNNSVVYKVQSGLGSPESGSGGSLLPVTGGSAMLSKQAIVSQQVRQDGMAVRGRHGTQATSGNYPGEFQMGNFDSILEAVMRGTWAAGASITQATSAMASATLGVSGHVVTFSTGSVITAGVRVNDVHVWTSALDTADRNKPLRVTGVTATTITYAESLTTVSGGVGTYAFAVKGKVLTNPAAGSLVKRYFTIEEYEADLDQSESYTDCVWGKLDFAMAPNGMITVTPSFTGTGSAAGNTGASSPIFTAPTLPLSTAIPLAAIDATVRLSDTGDLIDLTAFSLSIDLQLNAPAVAAAVLSPDVFDGIMQVSGSMTILRSDLIPFQDFIDETVLSLDLLAKVPGGTDFYSLSVPNFTLGGAKKSDINRAGGPRTVTLDFPAELVGVDQRGGAFDATLVKFQRSTST